VFSVALRFCLAFCRCPPTTISHSPFPQSNLFLPFSENNLISFYLQRKSRLCGAAFLYLNWFKSELIRLDFVMDFPLAFRFFPVGAAALNLPPARHEFRILYFSVGIKIGGHFRRFRSRDRGDFVKDERTFGVVVAAFLNTHI
jgi:hypothetical protein